MAVATPTMLPVPIVAERGAEGGEAGDIPLLALALIAAKDQLEGERQAHHLKQTQTQGKVDTGPDQQDQQGWTPDKAIDGGERRLN